MSSRLLETKKAFKSVTRLIDQQIRAKASNSKDLEEYRKIVEVAFYILAFGQFEYLVKKEANGIINAKAGLNTLDGVAWTILKQKGDVPLRKMLEIIYHADPKKLNSLNDAYTIRNDSVHNNAKLPKEAKDIELFILGLEELVADFDK